MEKIFTIISQNNDSIFHQLKGVVSQTKTEAVGKISNHTLSFEIDDSSFSNYFILEKGRLQIAFFFLFVILQKFLHHRVHVHSALAQWTRKFDNL